MCIRDRRDNNGNSSSSQKGGESGAAAGAEKQPAKGLMCFSCRGQGHYVRKCMVKRCSRYHEKGLPIYGEHGVSAGD